MNFTRAQMQLNQCETSEQKLLMIIDDIVQENNLNVQEAIPVFYGTIVSHASYYFVEEIKSIYSCTPLINPYTNTELTAFIGMTIKKTVNIGDQIVFSVTCGQLNKSSELIKVKDYIPLSSIRNGDEVSSIEVIEYIRDNSIFISVRDRIQTIIDAHYDRLAVMRETEEFAPLFERFEKLAPNGIEFTNHQLDELQERIDRVSPDGTYQGVEGIDKELSLIESRIKALPANGIDQSKKLLDSEIQTRLATISDLQKEEAQFENKKYEARQALRLIRFFLDTAVSDEHPQGALPVDGDDPINIIKNRLDFEYSDTVLIPFLSALSTTQIITLFGKPGTGKTTFVTKVAKALGAKCSIISVQNNWTDSADLLGYYSPIDKTYESTAFMEALLSAQRDWVKYQNQSRLHIICLDEMNLARVEYYFAAFLSILQLPEEERWIRPLPKHISQELNSIRLEHLSQIHASEDDDAYLTKDDVSGKEYLYALREYVDFKLPPNDRFVGTINSDDTTNFLSPKVIDRSFYIELTNEQYSQDRRLQNLSGFFPVEFFEVDDTPEDDIINAFSKENNRFKAYAQQMLKQYRDHLGNTKTGLLFDYIVMGKVLPALQATSDFMGYSESEFPLSSRAFESHKPKNNSNVYNYLGG